MATMNAFILAISELRDSIGVVPLPEYIEGINTLAIYINNLHKYPTQTRYHTISAVNPHFQDRFGHMPGSDGILRIVGFELDHVPVVHYSFKQSLLSPANYDNTMNTLQSMLIHLDVVKARLIDEYNALCPPDAVIDPNSEDTTTNNDHLLYAPSLLHSVRGAGVWHDKGRRETMEDKDIIHDQYMNDINILINQYLTQANDYVPSAIDVVHAVHAGILYHGATPEKVRTSPVDNLEQIGTYSNIGFYSVYDGHGGTDAVNHVVRSLHLNLRSEILYTLYLIQSHLQCVATRNVNTSIVAPSNTTTIAYMTPAALLCRLDPLYPSHKYPIDSNTSTIQQTGVEHGEFSGIDAYNLYNNPVYENTVYDLLNPIKLIASSLHRAFARTDSQTRHRLLLGVGTTAATCIIGEYKCNTLGMQRFLITANVGDSRVILSTKVYIPSYKQYTSQTLLQYNNNKDNDHNTTTTTTTATTDDNKVDDDDITSSTPSIDDDDSTTTDTTTTTATATTTTTTTPSTSDDKVNIPQYNGVSHLRLFLKPSGSYQDQIYIPSFSNDPDIATPTAYSITPELIDYITNKYDDYIDTMMSSYKITPVPAQLSSTPSSTRSGHSSVPSPVPSIMDITATRLTIDHKASLPYESSRFISNGGFIRNERVNGMLAISRALGDHHFKERQPYVVSSRPHIDVQLLGNPSSDHHPYLIIGCDGVWDVLDDQYAMNLISLKAAQYTLQWLSYCQFDVCLAHYDYNKHCEFYTILQPLQLPNTLHGNNVPIHIQQQYNDYIKQGELLDTLWINNIKKQQQQCKKDQKADDTTSTTDSSNSIIEPYYTNDHDIQQLFLSTQYYCPTTIQSLLPTPVINRIMHTCSKHLVNIALNNGSTDNVTAMVLRL